MSDWKPMCPHARQIGGATPGQAGVICGAMERDQARRDPILEGAPVGVKITAGEDPSTLLNFCCGKGDPLQSPDMIRHRELGDGHYTGCPIYAADREIADAERMFAPPSRIDAVEFEGHGSSVGPEALTAAERRALGLDGKG